ncbi:MAG: T9SS type A sorting domain-containing protein [Prevotella sp.]|nr:T9SS type A sorting domain-containing protein [Prevotella sp.]
MSRKFLSIIFAVSIFGFVSIEIKANTAIEIIDNDLQQNVSVSINESTLHVSGASGQTLYIYNVAGVCVMSAKVDGSDKRFDLNLPKGCYIVKVGKVVRKIYIR